MCLSCERKKIDTSKGGTKKMIQRKVCFFHYVNCSIFFPPKTSTNKAKKRGRSVFCFCFVNEFDAIFVFCLVGFKRPLSLFCRYFFVFLFLFSKSPFFLLFCGRVCVCVTIIWEPLPVFFVVIFFFTATKQHHGGSRSRVARPSIE